MELFGPYGGPGGVSWDDGYTHTGVYKIALSYKLGAGIGSFTTYYTEDKTKAYPHPSGDDTYTRVNVSFLFICLFLSANCERPDCLRK